MERRCSTAVFSFHPHSLHIQTKIAAALRFLPYSVCFAEVYSFQIYQLNLEVFCALKMNKLDKHNKQNNKH